MIYGRGSTSHSSIKVEYLDDNGDNVTVIKDLDDLEIESESYRDSFCNRIYKITDNNGLDVKIRQDITILPHTGISQDYEFKYYCQNNSCREIYATLMFNADSAYNNQDRVEEYFIDGNSVDNFSVYTKDNAHASQNSSFIHNMDAFQNNKNS